jgi:hypothetical protein
MLIAVEAISCEILEIVAATIAPRLDVLDNRSRRAVASEQPLAIAAAEALLLRQAMTHATRPRPRERHGREA